MRRLLTALACVALLASCGDDEPSIDPEADEERVEDANLTLDDLPDGYQEVENDDDDDDDNECNQDVLDIDEDDLDENKSAESGRVQFDDEVSSVRSEIDAFRDDELPQQVLDAIDDDEYLDCLEDQIVDELEGELVSFEEVDSPVDGGRSLQIRIIVPGPEGDLEVVSQQHAVLVDRFGISLQYTVVEDELDDGLVEDALDAMIERLEDED